MTPSSLALSIVFRKSFGSFWFDYCNNFEGYNNVDGKTYFKTSCVTHSTDLKSVQQIYFCLLVAVWFSWALGSYTLGNVWTYKLLLIQQIILVVLTWPNEKNNHLLTWASILADFVSSFKKIMSFRIMSCSRKYSHITWCSR